MKKNDEIIIDITATSSDGSGIGKFDNMAVFIPQTAEGDRVRALVLKVKKTYAFAKLLSVITPSNDRTDVDCSVFSRCGGCVYRHISYEKECLIKQKKVEDAVRRIGAIDILSKPIIAADSIFGYRNKAQYPVNENAKVGFYANHSHRIIEHDDCPLQPPVFSSIAKVFSEFLSDNGISVYNENSNSGLVRHLYLRIAAKTDEIMVSVVVNGRKLPNIEDLVSRLKNLLGDRLVSVNVNINTDNTNVILGKKSYTVYGKKYITDILCDKMFKISPLSFYQVNRDMAQKLYRKVSEYAQPQGKNILDLYCGAGTIGLTMADSAKSIIGVEIVEAAVEDAKQNAKLNNIDNAEFICSDAAEAARSLKFRKIKPDVVIVDPPRKGCDEALLKIIAEDFKPEKIVYVSCDPATFARDAKRLEDSGYKLLEYTPIDMFPRTAHVETVALLSKL